MSKFLTILFALQVIFSIDVAHHKVVVTRGTGDVRIISTDHLTINGQPISAQEVSRRIINMEEVKVDDVAR